jgi:hypothetical protein
MHDPRWTRLRARLLASGWVCRGDTLYAPHETLWFETRSDDPEFASFGDLMSSACAAAPPPKARRGPIDRSALQADLVSLVAALDDVLELVD